MTDDLRLRIAQELTTITTLHSHLADEALHQPANQAGLYIPGGDATVMAGPAANLEAWENQIDAAERAYFAGDDDNWLDISDQDSDPPPALLVLAYWEDKVRDERNQPTDLRATVRRAADYLRGQLDFITSENFLSADELARDLRALRTRLETVLKDGIRPDRGVPCMTCGTLLVKIWGNATDGSQDKWHCSTCETWSNHEQYKLAVKYAARAHATGLNASDMAEEYRIKPGSLTGWAAKGLVKKRGKDASGRQLYDVNDALEQRDRAESEVA